MFARRVQGLCRGRDGGRVARDSGKPEWVKVWICKGLGEGVTRQWVAGRPKVCRRLRAGFVGVDVVLGGRLRACRAGGGGACIGVRVSLGYRTYR